MLSERVKTGGSWQVPNELALATGTDLVGVIQCRWLLWAILRKFRWGRWQLWNWQSTIVRLLREGDNWRDGGAVLVGFIWGSRTRILAPAGLEWLVNLLRGSKLQIAGVLGNGGALGLGFQAGDQLSLETARLLWVQVTDLLRNINKRGNGLVMALLRSFFSDTPSTTDLYRQFLTAGITYKFARLLLNVAGCAGGLVDSPALLRALTIADLVQRLVALFHILINCLLLESNLAGLFKILLTNLLLGRRELGDIGVMTLLYILVCALKNGILLERSNSLFLLNAAKSSVGIGLTTGEINPSGHNLITIAIASQLATSSVRDSVGEGRRGQEERKETLKWLIFRQFSASKNKYMENSPQYLKECHPVGH